MQSCELGMKEATSEQEWGENNEELGASIGSGTRSFCIMVDLHV